MPRVHAHIRVFFSIFVPILGITTNTTQIMRNWIWVLLFFFMPIDMMSQSFEALWKQVEEAESLDQPKTMAEKLDHIISKAKKENSYGHLLKAQLRKIDAVTSVTPDSLQPEVERLVEEEKALGKKNALLAAVYQSVLGTVYKENSSLDENSETISKEYFKQSLSNPDLLASAKTNGWAPLLKLNEDSKLFDDDLLSVLAFQAGEFSMLYDYYDTHGRREAACITAAFMLREKADNYVKKATNSKYLSQVEQMIDKYKDLKVGGELALVKYEFLEVASDVNDEQRIKWIDEATEKWGEWPRINRLKNSRQSIIQPHFSLDFGSIVVRPNQERCIKLKLRHLSSMTMTVSKVNLDPRRDYSLYDQKTLATVKKAIISGTTFKVGKQFEYHPDYVSFEDSILLKPLERGMYLAEFDTNEKNISTARTLFYVSDVYLLAQPMPENQMRFVAVSATTGQPLKDAKLRIESYKKDTLIHLGPKGDIVVKNREGRNSSGTYYLYTDNDKYCPDQSMWMSNYSYNSVRDVTSVQLFTDRSIYRPGQTVHVGLIKFTVKGGLEAKALEGEKLTVVLRDANNKEIDKRMVVTDSFGKAAADFVLPQSGLTGTFSINAGGSRESFRVEEYKRPTFDVEMPVVKEAYKDGDTLTLKGYARTYSGVPVQGAKVAYEVERRGASWWWRHSSSEDEMLLQDSVVTDNEGAFTMRVPISLPANVDADDDDDWRSRFYEIVVNASVTDLGGETHEGELTLPISRKLTAFNFNLPSVLEREKLSTVTFSLLNNAGDEIDGDVTYYIDDEPKGYSAKTNEKTELPKDGALARSGKHTIKAICQGDTVKREIVLFSYEDKKPCIETHDWFQASSYQFADNDAQVKVQVGTSDPDQVVFYNVFADDKVLEQGTFTLSNSNQTRTWKYRKEYGSGVLLTFAWVRNGVAYTHTQRIQRPMPDKRIILKWETFRDKLTPGQQEEWILKATYPDGSPADAQLLATIYDKSLDQIESHFWWFNNNINVYLPSTSWNYLRYGSADLGGRKPFVSLKVPNLSFTEYDGDIFQFWSGRVYRYGLRKMMNANVLGGAPVEMVMESSMAMDSSVETEEKFTAPIIKKDEMAVASQKAKDAVGDEDKEKAEPQLRENLDETAAFIPQVVADADGRIALKFTLPESVTTWKMMGIATDRQINSGRISGEAIAKKDIMVVPNMPRFVRLGDQTKITARIFNTSDHSIAGKATVEMVDPETENVVFSKTTSFNTEANQTDAVTFDYQPDGLPGLLICRIKAVGDGISDGEQHYLPVLSNMELVTRTLPFTQIEPQTSAFDLAKLFPKGVSDSKLTIEYTNNPAWLMIQALPNMAAGSDKNAITQATSYYANAIGQYLMNITPTIKQTVMKWREETDSLGSLASNLEKNEELKDLLLNETPWVPNADKESSQKRSLVKYFDEQTISYRLSMALDKLKELQNGDGSWSWWEGMPGSIYMTTAVSEMFIRLNKMIGQQNETRFMLERAYGFMGDFLIKEMEDIQREQKRGNKRLMPSEMALCVLYNMALDGRELDNDVQKAADFLIGLFSGKPQDFTIYGKARSAVILAQFNKKAKAEEYLTSIDQYSVVTPEMGRYFDTRKAYYSWCSYNIPTEIAAMEAYKMLRPERTDFVNEMRLWLLQQKRAQMWDTPINSVDAVYAFLEGNAKALDNGVASVIYVDGQKVETSKETAGIGYVKTSMKADNKHKVEVEKTSSGTSWGALYAQFLQRTDEVENSSSGLSVEREIRTQSQRLKVGDKVTVRLTIKAERDLDFVEVIDRRASCMEPVSQLSGYHYGYYIAPKDYTTAYYFHKMPKGTHVIETEYYIDRKGTYETGTCKVQCAYAPEFSATGKALKLVVNE